MKENNIEIEVDLTKIKIKKYIEFITERLKTDTEIKVNPKNIEMGLDLTNNKSGYKIDLTKYGTDID
jgi:hypothetical protein